ncbi:MAG: hypothetical protein ABIU05_06665, partial [Nitrospirales bacterium]
KSCCVRPSRPAHALAPLLAVLCTAWVAQDYHLSDWPNFRGHFCLSVPSRTSVGEGDSLGEEENLRLG